MATRTHIVQADFIEAPFSHQSAQPPAVAQTQSHAKKTVRRSRKVAFSSARSAQPSAPADETHFAILQLGVSIWNQWRASEPLTRPNLRKANLSGFHLENINFCRVDLRGANLSSAYLYEADFQEADLRHANVTGAGLIGANLHKAIASGANFQRAYLAQSDLSNAKFTRASLQKADLQSALLTDTIFTAANIAEADFTSSFDLTRAQLENAEEAHLAYFEPALRAEMGLAPNEIVSPKAERAAQETEKISVFQPTHGSSAANKPALRKLVIG